MEGPLERLLGQILGLLLATLLQVLALILVDCLIEGPFDQGFQDYQGALQAQAKAYGQAIAQILLGDSSSYNKSQQWV